MGEGGGKNSHARAVSGEEKNRRDLNKALADVDAAIARAEAALQCCKRSLAITRTWDYLSAARENVSDARECAKGE